ncbi:MAG: ferredoxin--NADP reductase [Runella slithyformis]|jgi:ring-1,2-phenylacetyl-CoA epoxidase subunit PaaE|nr:MAG: ferredoxin--NADP reductase [Runella slithyformis]TAF93534.1 MAG: ferredoxin--NADP reductase [Runella sp.]TAG16110.1 MAG: ferredoxin--NADP reductase [Cytophagales bacterium]TAG35436.1 MAG: ferredoxin--NADP reductase [Cytophagia bacterium]TAF80625.1 MAG: ferredoxin--NADP reductase [Runella slithyformis]
MAVKYFHLKVKEVVRETPDAVTIHFWQPLSEQIKYQPGQFLTLLSNIDGQKVRRSYSMSSSPHTDAAPAVTVKRVTGGLVSNWLNDNVKEGDFLEVMEPMGQFTAQADARNSRTVVLIGAGSGITPLMAIAKSILKIESESRVVLLYGNRDEESIIFKQQLQALAAQFGNRMLVKHTLSQPINGWAGHTGRLNKTQILRLLEEVEAFSPVTSDYYLCGPDGLMEEAQRALAILEVKPSRIHKESFVSTPTQGEVTANDEDEDNLKTQEVTVLYEGTEYKFEVAPHQTILEAALDLDIDLPYSCQAGMCTACMAKCTSGRIKLDEEDGLTDTELKAGFILTCVAHPLSKDVVIEVE